MIHSCEMTLTRLVPNLLHLLTRSNCFFSTRTCLGWFYHLQAGLWDTFLCCSSPDISDQPLVYEQAWHQAVWAFSVYHTPGISRCQPTSLWICEDSNSQIYRCEFDEQSHMWVFPHCLLCGEAQRLQRLVGKSCSTSKYITQLIMEFP